MATSYRYYVKNLALETLANRNLLTQRLTNDLEIGGAPTSVSFSSPDILIIYNPARTTRQLYIIGRIFDSIYNQDLNGENNYQYNNNNEGGRNIYNTSSIPTGTNDIHSLYNVGSIVCSSGSTGGFYLCADNTVNNAKWKIFKSFDGFGNDVISYFYAYNRTTTALTISNSTDGTAIIFPTIGAQFSNFGTWTFGGGNTTITIPISGVYQLSYTLSIFTQTTTREVSTALYVNGAARPGTGNTILMPADHVGPLTGFFYITVNTGDVLILRCRTSTAVGVSLRTTTLYTLDNTRATIGLKLINTL